MKKLAYIYCIDSLQFDQSVLPFSCCIRSCYDDAMNNIAHINKLDLQYVSMLNTQVASHHRVLEYFYLQSDYLPLTQLTSQQKYGVSCLSGGKHSFYSSHVG